MIHSASNHNILFIFTLLIGFAISMGFSMVYFGYSNERMLQNIGIRHTFWQKYRMWFAGLMLICTGLLVLGLILLEDISARGTFLNTWALTFVAICVLATLLLAVPTILWLRQSNRKL